MNQSIFNHVDHLFPNIELIVATIRTHYMFYPEVCDEVRIGSTSQYDVFFLFQPLYRNQIRLAVHYLTMITGRESRDVLIC